MKYITQFRLTYPVNDFASAHDYLIRDSMVRYFREDSRTPTALGENVLGIYWVLCNKSAGYIVAETNSPLTLDEQNYLSDWVRGQCADGLGTGFEEQDFAITELDEDTYQSSSFDWRTSSYTFEEIMEN